MNDGVNAAIAELQRQRDTAQNRCVELSVQLAVVATERDELKAADEKRGRRRKSADA